MLLLFTEYTMSHQANTKTTPFDNSSKTTETYSPVALLKKVTIAILIGTGLMYYTGLDTAGTVPTTYFAKGGKKSHVICPYDYKVPW